MEGKRGKKRKLCLTRLLPDAPSREDALGGGHARTAHALEDLVLNTSGGKAVALFGGWGSGKSTVIKIFQKAVEKNPNVKVFVYDAWSHEGDPLRRSFLERLASFLEASGWIKGKSLEEIKNQMDELAGRKEVADSRTSTIVTPQGKWIGTFFTLGVPLGAALLSSQPVYLAPLWFWVTGLLAVFSPFLVALGLTIRNRRTKGRWEFPSLVSQNIHTTRTSTLRTPEPTSIEFAARFGSMMDRALSDDRRLVIVMDNLDRLPNDQAHSIWATMRTFFDVEGENWSKRLWLIVPIDPSAIPELWKGNDEGSAEVFVSKFFQARFDVPSPVLSDWKALFLQLLSEAFPSHNEEDFYAIYRVYRVFALERDHPPTPRELKQFVNLVGSQHRIWQDDIALPLQALYVALRKELHENPRETLSKRESEVKSIFPEAEKWKDFLLAQYFNVEPNKALQVLFLEDIRKGLEGQESFDLNKVAEQLEPRALGTLIHEALAETAEWVERAPENLAKAALAIEEIKDFLPKEDYQRALVHLREELTRVEKWTVWNNKVVQGLVALIVSAPGREIQRSLVRAILNGVELPSGNDNDTAIKEIAASLADFLDRLKRGLNLGPPEDFRFQAPEATDWIAVLSALNFQRLDEAITRAFTPPPSELSGVLNELSARAEQEKFGMDEARAVQALCDIEPDGTLNWEGLVKNLLKPLANAKQYPEERLWAMTHALLQLEPVDERARNALKQLAENWFLFHHLSYVNGKKSLATLLLIFLILNPTGRLQSSGGSANAGVQRYGALVQQQQPVDLKGTAEILARLAKRGSTTFSVQNLIQATNENARTKDLVAAILRNAEDAYPGEILSPDILVEHSDELTGLIGEKSLEEKYRAYQDKVIDEVLARELTLDLLPVYQRMLKVADGAPFKRLSDFLIKELKDQPKEFWLHCLQQAGEYGVLALLKKLAGRGSRARLDHKLADAIVEAATSLLQDDEDGEYDPEALRGYLEVLDIGARKNLSARLVRRLPELFSEHADRRAEGFLQAVGDVILDSAPNMDSKGLDSLLLNWFPSALKRLSQEELEWFAALLEKLRDRIPGLEEAIREEALSRVQEAREATEDEDISQLLGKIADLFQTAGKSP